MNETVGSPILEIRDPEVQADVLLQRVAVAVKQRRAAGAHGPDPASLGPESLRPAPLPGGEPADIYPDFQVIHRALADMAGGARLHELAFRSQVPVLGRLVVALRNAWSWMAARWIGRQIVEQQTAFNEATVQFTMELTAWQDACLRRLQQLEERLRNLEEGRSSRSDLALHGPGLRPRLRTELAGPEGESETAEASQEDGL